MNNDVLLLGYLIHYCLLFNSSSSLSALLFVGEVGLNTLPGVSTHPTSLVVVVCEHGVSPALKSPEVSLPKFQSSCRHLSSVAFASSSVFLAHQSFLFRTAQSFLWLDPRKTFILRDRNNLYLVKKILVAALTIFIFPPDYFMSNFYS